jgi:hypothetical protein
MMDSTVGASERRKGKRAEQDVARYLRENGYEAVTTRAASGYQSGYDIATDLPLAIEVKDHQRMDLSGWLEQAEQNATPERPGVVWHKRRGRPDPGDWYVTMSGATLLTLMRGDNDDGATVRPGTP